MIGIANQTIQLKHFTNHSALIDIEDSNKADAFQFCWKNLFFATPILDSLKGRKYV